MTKELLTFRNKPILRLFDVNKPNIKIQFGLSKARILLENIKEIEQFVVDCAVKERMRNAQEQTGCAGNSAQGE